MLNVIVNVVHYVAVSGGAFHILSELRKNRPQAYTIEIAGYNK